MTSSQVDLMACTLILPPTASRLVPLTRTGRPSKLFVMATISFLSPAWDLVILTPASGRGTTITHATG